jgi:PAS domain S-box-containing protein
MVDKLLPPQEFRQSFALIDNEGKLAAWDRGLEIEWSAAGHLIRQGASYAEIIRALATSPGAEAFMKENFPSIDPERQFQARIAGLGTERRHEYRTADGRTILVEERPIVSGGTQRIARDITDEKQVEDDLADARKRLEVVDSNEYGVLTESRRTPDGIYIFEPISEPLCRLFDLPAELVGGDPMLIFSRFERSAEGNAKSAALMEHAVRTLESFSEEYPIRDGQNRLRWIRQSMMPQREPDGTVVFSGVLRDVTREKEAEDQVEMLRSVVVRSSDSIVIMETDPGQERDSKIVYVNEKFTELFGWSADELIGQRSEILTANRPVIADTTLFAALVRDDGEPVEFETSSRNGRVFWVEARVGTIQKFDSGRYRWAVMSHDISERRHAQDELLRAKEEAEAGNRAKGEFLANMSHELRTPLNAIIGFTELIAQGVAQTGWMPAYSEYLDDVSESGHHLLDLINTVLDLSKIEAGQLKLDLDAVDLDEIVRRSLAMVSGMARDGEITLSEDIPAERLEIQADFRALKQVVLNVLSNAIKFTPPGGKVDLALGFTDTEAVITVTDTGCGIAEKDLERVMLPFVQVENSLSRRFGGSGLGLSIARDLCVLHRGSLRIASSEGGGTTVRILLPLTRQSSIEYASNTPPPLPGEMQPV